MWILENRHKPSERIAHDFPTKEVGERYVERMGDTISKYYKLRFESGNPLADRMITEGLVKGDLYKILLPRISVDEFVPGDPDTDNIVIAFFLKGVPEATLPFKTFAEQSNGVLSADYGDSETVVGAQNVYIEFDRDNLDMKDIHALMIQSAMLSGLETEDFSMTFPHTDEKFPYDVQTLKEYFISRDARKNEIAQKRAIDRAANEFEETLAKAQGKKKQQQAHAEQQQAQESLVERLSGVALTG